MPALDPYRTPGLPRDATLEEVKRAYRRLVKTNHPDAAGEAALPRFLAIQEAYDLIVGPDADGGRGGRGPVSPRRTWEADPDRAGATYRAYGGRPRPRPGPRTGPRRPAGRPAKGAGPTSTAGPGTGAGPASGGAAPGTPPPSGPGADGQPGQTSDPFAAGSTPGERRRRKATLGSTSYDDIEPGAFAPDWGGASWYGTTSGTYWTINPKEYADPRKHGPEYQARARRSGQVRARQTGAEAPPTGTDETPPDPTIGGDAAPGARPGRVVPPPTHTTSSWWEATTGDPSTTSTAAGAGPTQRPGPAPRPTTAAPAPPRTPAGDTAPDLSTDTLVAAIRGWLDDDHPTSAGRIGRAVIGWAPLALGAGWLAGEVSGCGRFAATCPPAMAPMTWVVQLGLLLLLILVPRLARVATIATIAILGTVFPASILLFATSDPQGAQFGRSVLGGLIVLAWLAGLGYGFVREVRRGVGPVS
jgi:curved DNA-binding protein CbpA